jgi:hypothetical protein
MKTPKRRYGPKLSLYPVKTEAAVLAGKPEAFPSADGQSRAVHPIGFPIWAGEGPSLRPRWCGAAILGLHLPAARSFLGGWNFFHRSLGGGEQLR